jgi:hypothetical protein
MISMAIIDTNECEMDNDCDSSATCINIEGSYLCTCNDGFRGGGRNCTLIGINIVVDPVTLYFVFDE